MSHALPHIAWNAQLTTGLSDIDDQHRQLVDMLNKLAELRNTKGNVDAVRQVMAELTSYAGYHFRLEEELMATWAVNPKNRAAHIKAHASFVEYLGRAEAMLTENV
ncbi:MAG: bacteriohemerythrin, partial [Giesbergeria sp.]